MYVTVKPEFANVIFGFNNSSAPLGERKDLHLLYNDAKAHNVTHILDMFEPHDEKQELNERGAEFLAKKDTPVIKADNTN